MTKPLTYIFTGDGKGKTSAALGTAVRAVLSGMKVAWIAWYKESSWQLSESQLPKHLPIDFYLLGKGFYIKNKDSAPLKGGGQVIDKSQEKDHKQAAQAALKKAQALIDSQKYDLIILDELNNAVHDKLIPLKKAISLITATPRPHLVITGRNAHKQLIQHADLVSQIDKVKHPYDQGIKAVKGLDF